MGDQKGNIGEQLKKSLSEALSTGDFSGLNNLVSDTVENVLREAQFQAQAEKEARQREAYRKQEEWKSRRWEESELHARWEERERERQEREARRRAEWYREQAVRRQAELERRTTLQDARRRQQEEWRQQQEQWRNEARQQKEQERLQRERQQRQAAQGRLTERRIAQAARMQNIGNVSSVLYTVFGGIGLGFSIIGLILMGAFIAATESPAGLMAIPAIPALLFGLMVHAGIEQRSRLNRAKRYLQLCGSKMYGVLEELAKRTGKSLRFLKKDVRKMLQKGFFPEGHLDDQETCLMLTDEVYRQYQQVQAAHEKQLEEQRLLEAKAAEPKSLTEQVEEARRQQEAELNAMVAEGMDTVRKLRDLNDQIPGEEISQRLYQLENLLNEIFDRVRTHPEQMHRMHKMMDYYLPTTIKLVEAYRDFEKVSEPGSDIREAKAEIEKTLGIINEAFRELLNNLFQDAAFDVTTDAQVLQTMLAREGLTRQMELVGVPRGEEASPLRAESSQSGDSPL